MSLDYLQGYSNLFCARDSQSDSYHVIGWARSASWSCSGTSSWCPVWHDDMAYTERIGSRPSGIDLSPRTSAVYRCTWSHWGHPFMTSARRGSGSGGRMWTGGEGVQPHVDVHTEN